MTPIFDKSSSLSEFGNKAKYVREGETVAFGSTDTDHSALARDYNLGVPIKEGLFERKVDDAALIFDNGINGFALRGDSSTCKVRGDPSQAKEVTAKIIQEITGKNVERF